jgi:hypothetical protein
MNFQTAAPLVGILRSRWLGRALVVAALALLAVLFVRFQAGYIPRFFAVALPVALLVFAMSLAVFLAEPSRRQAFAFLLCTATALAVFIGAAPAIVPPTAVRIYLSQEKAPTRVVRHSLPRDPALFRDGFDKTALGSLSDLGRWAARFHQRWRADLLAEGLTEGEAKAASMMLFASTLWAYGNAREPRREGCITANEDNDWRQQKPTLEVVKAARIGCCQDYAHALSLILSKNGFENRYLSIPGHTFNEARVDGRWYVLDANTNVIMDSAWNEAPADPGKVTLHVFPHPGSQSGKLRRQSLAAFQDYVVNVVLLGNFPAGTQQKGRDPDPEYRQAIDTLY